MVSPVTGPYGLVPEPTNGMIDPRWNRPLVVFREQNAHVHSKFSHKHSDCFIKEIKRTIQTSDEVVKALDSRLRQVEEGMYLNHQSRTT